ncbi:MAG: homocysteine S-methyltransferase family protein [Thermodesulfobacteriota bacterium]
MSITNEQLLIFDGACGTTLQSMNLPADAWEGIDGCNEYLNLSAPQSIIELHGGFLEAGAMVIETNTFGASSLVLGEYGLEDRVEEINHAAVRNARKAISECSRSDRNHYVAGSVGPTTKLPILGHIEPAALAASVKEQMRALIEAGVDCLIIETCQDLLQVKTVLVACFELLEELGRDLPVLSSVTFEQQGTMLVGSDIGAVCATIAPFPVISLGLNCATGPVDMEPQIHYLSENWDRRISCIPNQGMPIVQDGETVYPLSPSGYADHMLDFIDRFGISIIGGCCGTSPAHIRALADALANRSREVRS